MLIEIIAEAIRRKSFISQRRKKRMASLVYLESVINAPRRNKPRQKSVNRSVIVAATGLTSVK